MMPTCPVCLDEKELIPLETCSHGICSTCIVKTLSFRDNCPVCRTVWCPDMMSSGVQNTATLMVSARRQRDGKGQIR